MKKRTLCLLLAGVMALSLLSGCGGKPTGGQPNTPNNPPTAGNDNVPNNEVPLVPPDDWEETAQPEDDLPFPRDPRWDELQPGETAVQYYDIFIKTGMTVGEVVEAIESSNVYQEQFITWVSEADRTYGKLDNELKCSAPGEKRIKISDGTEVVMEQALYTNCKYISVKSSDKHIMSLWFPKDLPGEKDTVYHVRDLPIVTIDVASYSEDSVLTFMGLNGGIKNMGRADVENLLDTVFKVRQPDTQMVADRKTMDGKGFYTYDFYSPLPLSISWNGYSLWTYPSQGGGFEGEPVKGVVTMSWFYINANTDRPRNPNGWSIGKYGGHLYWVADDAG